MANQHMTSIDRACADKMKFTIDFTINSKHFYLLYHLRGFGVFGGSWWFFVVFGGSWWLWVNLSGSWWFLVVLGDS